jgi:sugar phosphate isomerase/epimerase
MSTYSVREHLDPMSIDLAREFLGSMWNQFVGPEGVPEPRDLPRSSSLQIAEFPGRARAEFGVDAVETVALQFSGPDDPRIGEFGSALRSAGMQLLNVAIDPGDLLQPDDAKRAEQVAAIRAWIDRFAQLGSRFVRVNPGSPFSDHHGILPPAYLVESLAELGRFAQECDTRLLVENHGGPSSDPVWLNALLDAAGHEHLGLLLDLGNFDALTRPLVNALQRGGTIDLTEIFEGVDLSPVYEGIDALAGRAELVHVKVHEVAADGSIGAVDLERALGILAAHRYNGPLTVEYEGTGGDPWAKSRHILDVVHRLVTQSTVGDQS